MRIFASRSGKTQEKKIKFLKIKMKIKKYCNEKK